jgi:two-component system, repressor protein LuxO
MKQEEDETIERTIRIHEFHWYWLMDMAQLVDKTPGQLIEIYVETFKGEIKKASGFITEVVQEIENRKCDASDHDPKTNLENPDRIIPFEELERDYIAHAVSICRGNIQKAALAMGLSPATVYRKISQYEIPVQRNFWERNTH